MNDVQDLYREVILDHNRHPRNFGEMEDADRVVEAVNPLCGDRLTLYVKMNGAEVKEISFKGTGCAISVASSSLMTERARGRSTEELETLFEQVHRMLTGNAEEVDLDGLDKLAVLSGVREYPTRIKCASLAWHALKNAISGSGNTVSTE